MHESKDMYCDRKFEQWKIKELRKLLIVLDLSTAGKKAELIERLCEADPDGTRAGSLLNDAVMSQDESDYPEEQTRGDEGGQENMASGSNNTRNPIEVGIRDRELELLRRERDVIARE